MAPLKRFLTSAEFDSVFINIPVSKAATGTPVCFLEHLHLLVDSRSFLYLMFSVIFFPSQISISFSFKEGNSISLIQGQLRMCAEHERLSKVHTLSKSHCYEAVPPIK